jgi:inner membrane protein
MDILTHTLSGMAVASAAAVLLHTSKAKRMLIIAMGAIAGALPDLDAISMWSGFDDSFGKWFHLEHSGRSIYSQMFWYSHHGAMHSLLASFCIPLFPLLIWALIYRTWPGKNVWAAALVFSLSYNAHLIGDLPTPGGSWKGIAFFYPAQHYVGGYGATWWWNNYDIFLLVLLCVLINTVLCLVIRRKHYAAAIVLFATFSLCIYQLYNRNFDFNNSSYTYEQKNAESLEIQKETLGEPLYNLMARMDKSLPVHF